MGLGGSGSGACDMDNADGRHRRGRSDPAESTARVPGPHDGVSIRSRRRAATRMAMLALIGTCTLPAMDRAPSLTATVSFPPHPLAAPLRLIVRIANQTGQPVRIGTYLSVRPEVLGAAGRIIPFEGGTNMARAPRPSDFVITAPGASAIIPTTGVLRLHATELEWLGGDGLAGIWRLCAAA